jgi:hypothetical protein
VESFETVMNATRTTLSDVLWRWARGIARAYRWRQDGAAMPGGKRGLSPVIVGVLILSASLLLFARPAEAQISLKSTPGNPANNWGKTTGTTLTLGTPAVVAGDLAVVVFDDLVLGASPTIADNLGNTWTPLQFWNGSVRGSAWFSSITVAGSILVTVTFGSSANARAGVLGIFTGVASASPLDKNPVGTADSLTPYDAPLSGVLAQADELVIGLFGWNGPDGDTTAATAPDLMVNTVGTIGAGGNTNAKAAMTYRVVSATTSVAPQTTNTGSRAGVTGTATFKAVIVNKIAVRGSQSAVTAATTLTINKPAGTVAGDVMIASIAFRLMNLNPPNPDPRDIAVAAPAGWTLVRRMDQTADTPNGLAIYWKLAGGSEPASYSWTFSCQNVSGNNTCVALGFGQAAGGIVSFSGVDTATPIDVENGQSNAQAATQATPNITTTVANTMLVTTHSIPNANVWQNPPPSGMTQAYQNSSTPGVNQPLMIQVSTALQAAPGATGTKSATDTLSYDTSVDSGNAHILALRPLIKFYFHDAATPDVATLPGATTLSATVPNVTAATAGTNRDMNQTIGTAQVSQALTTQASTSLQKNWFRRFLSRPLLAQTLPTGVWTIQGGASEPNALSNMIPWGAVIKAWRPSTGALVATLLDNPTLGSINIPGPTETNMSTATSTISGVAVNDGDILVVELWAQNTQNSATAYANTIFYDGTTEGSTSSNAAFLLAPGNIAFYRSAYQSAYRWFDNTNTTDVGAALAAQDTVATVGTNGSTFRLRMLLHIADIDLGSSGQAYKLQFVGKGTGTCAAPTGGTPAAYTDVTAATVIAYKNNAAPADGATLTANANDPIHGGHTVVNQTYEELNNFTNSVSAINAGQDGKWDFALTNNGAPIGTNYCFRAVKSTGTVLDYYYVYPEITTSVGATTPGNFNAFETSTAAGATTGQVYTKLVGTNFSLDVVANLTSAQLATFTNTVQADLVTGAAGGQNCPGTPVAIAGAANTQSVNLTGGRGTTANFNVTSAYPDVRVRVRYPVVSPTSTSCSTDNFSIRPTAFTVTTSAATGGTAASQTGTSGTPAIKTGASFNLTAASVAGYNGTPTIDNTPGKVAGTPTAGTIGGSFGAAPVGTGTATGNSFTYSEVGNFGLNADAVRDTAFTTVDQGGDCIASSSSNTLSGGKYGCWVGNTATGATAFGRFIPDNFNVAYTTPPVFGTVCGTFTYVGTKFTYPSPVMTVTARNGASLGNATTTNYTGSYMKLTNASLTPATQLLRYPRFDALGGGTTPALDTAGLPAPAGDPAISFTNGVGTLTFGPGTGLAFTRSTTTPNAPFNADIALAVNVIDTDGVVYAGNPASFGAATSGGGISFSSGNAMRFGRLVIRNANGSQFLPLQVRVEAQYWSGAPTNAFITNTLDNCTTIASANNAMGTYTANLSSCETAISGGGTLNMGRKTLQLAAPGSANNGSVVLTVNLGASASGNTCTAVGAGPGPATTTANLPHLQGNWTGANYDQNPTARATFGVSSGANEVIFVRENF